MTGSSVTIHATSDLHAHWQTEDGGISRVLGALAERDRDGSVLIDNGDLLTGSVLGSRLVADGDLWRDGPHPVLIELEAAGYDVAVPGNHDFDHGIAWLRRAIDGLSSLRYLCANCVDARTAVPILPGSTVIERAGRRIGVVGVVTEQVQRLSRAEGLIEVRFTDAVAAARAEVEGLLPVTDAIVVAIHAGFANDPETGAPFHYPTGEDRAAELIGVTGVDAVVAGHQHWVRAGIAGTRQSPVGYAQPGYAGSHLAVIELNPAADGRLQCVRSQVVPMAGQAPAPGTGRLARLDAETSVWLAEPAPIDDEDLHAAVRRRLRAAATAIAVPPVPRSWQELTAAFAGIYGASRLQLKGWEYQQMLQQADAAGFIVDARPDAEWGSSQDLCEVAVNAQLRAFAPTGRVEEDSVVNWLDEWVGMLRARDEEDRQ